MTLTNAFDRERDGLQQRIDDDPLPEKAVKASFLIEWWGQRYVHYSVQL